MKQPALMESPTPNLRVLLAEDNPYALAGAAAALADLGFDVVSAETFDQALMLTEGPPFRLAVVDVALRRLGQQRADLASTAGLDLLDRLRQRWPSAALVIWTAYPHMLPHPAELITRFGCRLACAVKGGESADFVDAIEAALAGRIRLEAPAQVSPPLSLEHRFLAALPDVLAAQVAVTAAQLSKLSLTPREHEVMRLIGIAPELAAERMGLRRQRDTVDGYRSTLYERLGLNDGAQTQSIDRRSLVMLAYLLCHLRGESARQAI